MKTFSLDLDYSINAITTLKAWISNKKWLSLADNNNLDSHLPIGTSTPDIAALHQTPNPWKRSCIIAWYNSERGTEF